MGDTARPALNPRAQRGRATILASAIAAGATQAHEILYLIDGRICRGNVVDARPHGNGRMIWPNCALYVGEWSRYARHGAGTYREPEGVTYVGGTATASAQATPLHVAGRTVLRWRVAREHAPRRWYRDAARGIEPPVHMAVGKGRASHLCARPVGMRGRGSMSVEHGGDEQTQSDVVESDARGNRREHQGPRSPATTGVH